jgi:hypothetical protein
MSDATFKDSIPHLDIEVLQNGCIRLENESMGDSYVVDLHPIHLRHLAEKMGLLPALSATDAELLRTERGRVAELERGMDRYKRALLAVRCRSEQLYNNVFSLSQLGHVDMGVEVAQAAALSDFADHICIEFEDDFTADTPAPIANAAQEANLPAKLMRAEGIPATTETHGQFDLLTGDTADLQPQGIADGKKQK